MLLSCVLFAVHVSRTKDGAAAIQGPESQHLLVIRQS